MRREAGLAPACIAAFLWLGCAPDTVSITAETDSGASSSISSAAAPSTHQVPVAEQAPATAASSAAATTRSVDGSVASTSTTSLHGGCDEAKVRYLEGCKLAPKTCPDPDAAPPLGDAAFGAILNNGTYLSDCRVPGTMAVHVCATVQNGRALGVTVTTSPGDDVKGRCVAQAVNAMSFPWSPNLDVARTTFAAQ